MAGPKCSNDDGIYLPSQFSSTFSVLAILGRLPPSSDNRLTFYQFSDPSKQRGLLFPGSSSQTLEVDSHVLSLVHIFIPTPITETLLGLIQVQSQPLELDRGKHSSPLLLGPQCLLTAFRESTNGMVYTHSMGSVKA